MASERGLSRRRMWEELPAEEEAEVYVEVSERVPPSLQPIVPILRAANEIERDNPRVAYLCRFTAYEKAHTMDPDSSGRGVRQFKTYILHKLEMFDTYAKGVEKEKASYSHYNILPLNISGPTQPVMEIPEIKAAVDLLRMIENLPKPRLDPTSMSEEINRHFVPDLLDWLWQTFGFQDEQDTKRELASTDAKEIERFYEQYCRKNLEEGLQTRKP